MECKNDGVYEDATNDVGAWGTADDCAVPAVGVWEDVTACGVLNAGLWVNECETTTIWDDLPEGDPECLLPITATGCTSEDPCNTPYPQIGDPCCDSPDPCVLDINDFECSFIESRTITSSLRGSGEVGLSDAACNGLPQGTEVEHDGLVVASQAYSDPTVGRMTTLFFPWASTWVYESINDVNNEVVDAKFDYDSGLDTVYWCDVTMEHLSHDGTLLSTPETVRRPIYRKRFQHLGSYFMSHEFLGEVRNQGTGPNVVHIGYRSATRINGDLGTVEEKLRVHPRVFFIMSEERAAPLNWDDCSLTLNGNTDPSNFEFDGLVPSMDGESFFLFWSIYNTTYCTNWSRCTISAADANSATITIEDEGTIANGTFTNNFLATPSNSNAPHTQSSRGCAANNREFWGSNGQQASTLYTIDDANVMHIQCLNVVSGFTPCTDAPSRQYSFEMSSVFPIDGGLFSRYHSSLHLCQKDVLA